MTQRDDFLNEFFNMVERHPLGEQFWEVVVDAANEMEVPSVLSFTDEPHILLAEWRDLKPNTDWSHMEFAEA
jgi:hypothetical protein